VEEPAGAVFNRDDGTIRAANYCDDVGRALDVGGRQAKPHKLDCAGLADRDCKAVPREADLPVTHFEDQLDGLNTDAALLRADLSVLR